MRDNGFRMPNDMASIEKARSGSGGEEHAVQLKEENRRATEDAIDKAGYQLGGFRGRLLVDLDVGTASWDSTGPGAAFNIIGMSGQVIPDKAGHYFVVTADFDYSGADILPWSVSARSNLGTGGRADGGGQLSTHYEGPIAKSPTPSTLLIGASGRTTGSYTVSFIARDLGSV